MSVPRTEDPLSGALNGNSNLAWIVYERCVAGLSSQEIDDISLTILPNVNITGTISGVQRQIDVLIDARWAEQVNRRIIIDAKHRTKKVNINDVESFEGLLKDCRATHGILVCTKGFTKGAIRRAQDFIAIRVMSLEEIWDYQFSYEFCLSDCTTPQIGQRGWVLWSTTIPIFSEMVSILQVGICDGCHAFHIWCWDCGEKFPVPDGKVVKCGCNNSWAALLNFKKKEVTLCVVQDGEAQIIPLDRRPLE